MAKSEKISSVTHVIFDMDGTLLDTESVHNKTYTTIVQEFGKVFPIDLRIKILGTQELDGATLIINTLGLNITPQEFLKKVQQIEEKELPKVKLMHGVEDLVTHLHSKGIPMAVATSSGRHSFDLKTSCHKHIFDLFHHVVTGPTDPEVKKGKPAPDIFNVCASRFDEKPENVNINRLIKNMVMKCLVIEDSPNGVTAAIAAGMQVVMIPDPLLPRELTTNATMVLDSLEDFEPECFGLASY